MPRVAIDWKDDLLPEGEYNAVIEDVDEHLTRKGEEALKWWFIVHPDEGGTVRLEAVTMLVPRKRWTTKKFLEGLGYETKGSQVVDTDALRGVWCRVLIGHREFNNQEQESIESIVRRIDPPEGLETPQVINQDDFANPFNEC